MKDKTQKLTSYISGAGIKVYETIQYNKKVNDWYIVGDCTTSKKLALSFIRLHNLKLKYE